MNGQITGRMFGAGVLAFSVISAHAETRALYPCEGRTVGSAVTSACTGVRAVDDGAKAVAWYPGVIDAASGWKTVADSKDGVTYLPFEGYFPSKGGRIESPRIRLDKRADENAWYELSFEATSETNGLWWVDLYDGNGKWLPDVNSRLYPSDDWRRYTVAVPTRPDAVEAVVAFVSKKPVKARNVKLVKVPAERAAELFRQTYAEGPQLPKAAVTDSWTRLPRARVAIGSAKSCTIVFLGDSIMNDTWCGGLDAFLRCAYPQTAFRNVLSVRGSTGCWYYHEAKHFEEYVAQYKPDLVVIGGVSNWNKPKGEEIGDAEECLVRTIGRCRHIGADVVVCSPPKSYDPRSASADAYWLRYDYIQRAAARTGVPFWDMTTAPVGAVRASGKPLGWFNRDEVHSDNRGKVLNALTLLSYFKGIAP